MAQSDENLKKGNEKEEYIPYTLRNNLKEIKREEFLKHNTAEDCWVVIQGIVYNLTDFLDDHPGGSSVLVNVAGQDCTEQFEEVGHSVQARKLAKTYEIGYIEGEQLTALGWDRQPKYNRDFDTKAKGISMDYLKIMAIFICLGAVYYYLVHRL